MLSGRYRSACRRFLSFEVSPSRPDLKIEYITMYGFASGATDRTSTRELFSLPIGMRIIERRSLNLVRRVEVRVQTTIGVYAGIQHQANIIGVGQNTIDKRPPRLAQLFFAFRIPKRVLPFLVTDRNVGVHPVAVHAHHRLGQEAGSQAHARGHLATN